MLSLPERQAVQLQSSGPEEAPADITHLVRHLDAAYNLARWLVRNESDAEDLVQEAYLRAARSIGSLRGSESRPWMLAIVRNACYDWLRHGRVSSLREASPEEIDSFDAGAPSPEAILLQKEDAAAVRHAIDRLPLHLREVLILRELEQLSYQEIAAIAGVPKGTVMSRLFRARKHLECSLGRLQSESNMKVITPEQRRQHRNHIV
jgi:RNA polymerase sigma factor (sigma-70 family)